MKVTDVNRSTKSKRVMIEAPEDADKAALTSIAYEATGETPSSVFGVAVEYWPGSEVWTVTLWTD